MGGPRIFFEILGGSWNFFRIFKISPGPGGLWFMSAPSDQMSEIYLNLQKYEIWILLILVGWKFCKIHIFVKKSHRSVPSFSTWQYAPGSICQKWPYLKPWLELVFTNQLTIGYTFYRTSNNGNNNNQETTTATLTTTSTTRAATTATTMTKTTTTMTTRTTTVQTKKLQ